MTTALGFRQCGTLGCQRAVVVDPCVHAFCERCESRYLTGAFADSPSGAARVVAPSATVQRPAGSRVVVTAGVVPRL